MARRVAARRIEAAIDTLTDVAMGERDYLDGTARDAVAHVIQALNEILLVRRRREQR